LSLLYCSTIFLTGDRSLLLKRHNNAHASGVHPSFKASAGG
jgi:hypothetical protein